MRGHETQRRQLPQSVLGICVTSVHAAQDGSGQFIGFRRNDQFAADAGDSHADAGFTCDSGNTGNNDTGNNDTGDAG